MSALPNAVANAGDGFKKWRDIAGASFLYCESPRPERCGVHSHDSVRVSFLLRGNVIEVDDRGGKTECGPLSLHATPPGMRHAHLIRSPRVTTLCFSLELGLLSKIGGRADIFADPVTSRRSSVIALAPKFRREVLATDSASELVLQSLVLELASELSGGPKLTPDSPPWLRRARELLHDVWNQSVSIEGIAAEVGVHPSHLNRMFRLHLNQSPGEYLRALRIERATREVLSSDLPLKAIAVRAGFADQAHFTRVFRQRHGVSPIEMRRLVRDL